MLFQRLGHALEVLAGAKIFRRRPMVPHGFNFRRAITELGALIQQWISKVNVKQPRVRNTLVAGVEEFIDEVDPVRSQPRFDSPPKLDARTVELSVAEAHFDSQVKLSTMRVRLRDRFQRAGGVGM